MASTAGTDLAISSVKQLVTDRIKAQFAELIPEDAWKAVVEQATAEFLRVDLPKLIKDELATTLRERVKAELSDAWDPNTGSRVAGEVVATVIKEHSHVIVNAMVGNFVQEIVNAARYRA